MIELHGDRLDPRLRERWRAALAAPSIASSRITTVGATAWLSAVLSFVALAVITLMCLWSASPAPATILGTLGALAALSAAWRTAADHARRRRAWPSGRFLYRWGYVEVEDDVMRVAPAAEVRVTLGRAFAGQPEIDICGDGWRCAISIDPRDEDRVASMIARFGPTPLPVVDEGYRAEIGIVGPRWRPSRWPRDAVLAVGVAFGALGLVVVMIVAGAHGRARSDTDRHTREVLASQVTEPYVRAFAPWVPSGAPHVDVSLDPCSPADAAAVARGIAALGAASGGTPLADAPLHDPSGSGRGVSDPSVRAACSFHVDREHRAELHVLARLRARGETRLAREARVTMEEALAAALTCSDQPLPTTPAYVARTMLAYARAVLERDVLPETSAEHHRSTWALCISEASRATQMRDAPIDE